MVTIVTGQSLYDHPFNPDLEITNKRFYPYIYIHPKLYDSKEECEKDLMAEYIEGSQGKYPDRKYYEDRDVLEKVGDRWYINSKQITWENDKYIPKNDRNWSSQFCHTRLMPTESNKYNYYKSEKK